jgi:hypothetical protein
MCLLRMEVRDDGCCRFLCGEACHALGRRPRVTALRLMTNSKVGRLLDWKF